MPQPTGSTSSFPATTILSSRPLKGCRQEGTEAELKLEDVRAVLAEKSRAGHTAEVRALLKKYGAAKLSEIDPANYEALMKDAEVIGNGS
jgi:hypothetical protein